MAAGAGEGDAAVKNDITITLTDAEVCTILEAFSVYNPPGYRRALEARRSINMKIAHKVRELRQAEAEAYEREPKN
jgi:hypothetical protein